MGMEHAPNCVLHDTRTFCDEGFMLPFLRITFPPDKL